MNRPAMTQAMMVSISEVLEQMYCLPIDIGIETLASRMTLRMTAQPPNGHKVTPRAAVKKS